MQPYLMLPSVCRRSSSRAAPFRRSRTSVVGGGVEAGLVVVDELAASVSISRRDAGLDRARRRIGNALHEGEVMALEAVLLEQLAAGGVRVLRQRHGERTDVSRSRRCSMPT